MQQKELIDELLDGGTQSIEDDLEMKAEKEMCKDISTRQDQNFILMKEEVEQSPWTVMKFEEEESVLFKSMIIEYNSVIDGMELMLCSDQKRMPREISTGTSESCVFETNYWCMFAGIEELLSDVIMEGEIKQLS